VTFETDSFNRPWAVNPVDHVPRGICAQIAFWKSLACARLPYEMISFKQLRRRVPTHKGKQAGAIRYGRCVSMIMTERVLLVSNCYLVTKSSCTGPQLSW
jgi:hypothetical protein